MKYTFIFSSLSSPSCLNIANRPVDDIAYQDLLTATPQFCKQES